MSAIRATATLMLWASTMTGVHGVEHEQQSHTSLQEAQQQHVAHDENLRRRTTTRRLENQKWYPLGDYWSADEDYNGPLFISMSRNGECFAASSKNKQDERAKVAIRRVMPDGTWVPFGDAIISKHPGKFNGYEKSKEDTVENFNQIALSSDCEYIAVAVGARVHTPDGPIPGSGFTKSHSVVRVHRYSDSKNAWVQVGGDMFGPEFSDGFGWHVSMSDDGSRVVSCGQVFDPDRHYICQAYQWTDDSWEQLGQTLEYNRNEAHGKISGDGKVVVVTAVTPYVDSKRFYRVYVYELDESGSLPRWKQRARLKGGDDTDFGDSLSMTTNGDILAIGSPGWTKSNNSRGLVQMGRVQVYKWDSPSSSYEKIGDPIKGGSGDACGESVSLSNDGMRVAVGCDQKWVGASIAHRVNGYVRVLNYNASFDTWTQVGEQEELIGGRDDKWGNEVYISGNGTRIFVGSSWAELARVYQYPKTIVTIMIEPPEDVTVECGNSISSAITGIATATTTDSGKCNDLKIAESDLTDSIGCGGEKTIERTWTAIDGCGNIEEAKQKIRVVDTTAPIITVLHDTVLLGCGDIFDPIAGVRAFDNCEGPMESSNFYYDTIKSSNFHDSGSVDANTIGTYRTTAGVSDACNHRAEVTRTVLVAYKIKSRHPLGHMRVRSSPGADKDFVCVPSLKNSTKPRLALKLKLKDCNGNAVTDSLVGTGLEPRLNRILKFGSNGMEITNAKRRKMRKTKTTDKWRYIVNEAALGDSGGCYVAEFQIPLPGGGVVYANAAFVLE